MVCREAQVGSAVTSYVIQTTSLEERQVLSLYHEVMRDGRAVTLSPKEFGVLHVLLRADGAVVSPETLLERVWDEQVDPFTNTVRVTVMNLRRKLGTPAVIETVIGTGYRLA